MNLCAKFLITGFQIPMAIVNLWFFSTLNSFNHISTVQTLVH